MSQSSNVNLTANSNINDVNLNELLGKIENIALKNTKSRESLEFLKLLYRIAINYNSFSKHKDNLSKSKSKKKNKSSLSSSSAKSSSSAIAVSSLKVNPIFIEKFTTLILDPNTPFKVKILSLSIIAKISVEEPQLLHKNLKTFESKVLSLLLSLLLTNASEESTSLFVSNIPLIVQSISMQDPILRPFSMPSLLMCARHFSDSISNAQIKSIETQLSQYLSHASLVSDNKQASSSFFKIGASTAASPVTELDGSVSIEFFTVLNNSQNYTEDQSFNIYSFSLLYAWLTNLYCNSQQTTQQQKLISDSSPPITPRQTNESDQQQQQQQTTQQQQNNRVLNPNFQSTIVSYCLRIIDQSKLKPPGQDAKMESTDNLSVIALLESIRILDFLCCHDVNLVPKIFPTVQKAYQLHLPSSRTTNANSGHVLLALLQFFVNHSHTLIYDPEPLFRAYFQTYLPRTYMNSFVAFETLNFCIINKDKLLQNSNVFGLYFPPIFKCLAWSPQSYIGEFSELLPSLISTSTFIEVFHLLLDLPLLTSSMESVLVEQRKFASMGSVDVGDVNDTAWSEYRVLYNYLLRNESGVTINFWSTTTLPLLHQFCKKTPITPRVIGTCELVPSLLHIYFDILLGYGDRSIFIQLIPVIFERIDQIFPFEPYQLAIKETLIGKILSVFNRYPSLVVSERDLLIQLVTEGRLANDIVQSLCWIIGEYSSQSICPEMTSAVFNDYHEALELITYEKINLIKMEQLSGASQSSLTPGMSNPMQLQQQQMTTASNMPLESVTMMLVLISSLTKIASRWPEASSRVILCLLKVLSYHQYFDIQVISRANECISLLKYPSFTTAVYDCAAPSNKNVYIKPIHQDNHTSLSFLLHDPTKDYQTNNPIHPYILSTSSSLSSSSSSTSLTS